MKNNPKTMKSVAKTFLISVSSGNVDEAYGLYIGEDFKHHNIYFKADVDSLRIAMHENALLFPDKKLEIKHVIL